MDKFLIKINKNAGLNAVQGQGEASKLNKEAASTASSSKVSSPSSSSCFLNATKRLDHFKKNDIISTRRKWPKFSGKMDDTISMDQLFKVCRCYFLQCVPKLSEFLW